MRTAQRFQNGNDIDSVKITVPFKASKTRTSLSLKDPTDYKTGATAATVSQASLQELDPIIQLSHNYNRVPI